MFIHFPLYLKTRFLSVWVGLVLKKATGLDGIPARFVRDSASIIACPLRHVINLSLIQGIVPDDLKSARVVPIFKKNDKTAVGNYRPVSILSIISNFHTKKLLVMSLIQCHFDYACSFWYMGISKLLKNRLQVTQNKIIRFVLKIDPRSHVGANEFNSIGWLPVSRRVDQIILNHVFKINPGSRPSIWLNILYKQVLYIFMALGLGKEGTSPFLK